jgi:hypothetical protein
VGSFNPEDTSVETYAPASGTSKASSGGGRSHYEVREVVNDTEVCIGKHFTYEDAQQACLSCMKQAKIGEQFVPRFTHGPKPETIHWKGVTKAGLIEYYGTWEAAKEASKKDRELRITMVVGPSESGLPTMSTASDFKALSYSVSVEARVAQ